MKSTKTILVLAAVVSLWGGSVALSAETRQAPEKSAEKRSQVVKPGVVAVVNGSDIALADFNRELNRMERIVIDTGNPLTCRQISRLRTEVVEGLIRRELLYQESKKQTKVSESEIDERFAKIKAQYENETAFANALNSVAATPALLKAQIERTLSVEKMITTVFVPKAVVTDQDIWTYYDHNRDSFRQAEQVRASLILIKVDPQWSESRKAESRKKLEDILAKVRQGQDFASLARTYSEDPSSTKGGDLGYIRTGQILKPIEDALFSLKPGEISAVVETSAGYSLVKATERKPEATIPFETVKDQLRTALKREKAQTDANAYTATLREKAKVEISLPLDE